MGLLVAVVALSLVGLLYTPYDPIQLNSAERLSAPSAAHPFGTDQYGRDVLSRLMKAGFVSLGISTAAVAIALLIGSLLGAVAGYVGGWFDKALMLFLDAWMSLPGLLSALAIVAIFGPNQLGVIGALSLAYCPMVARVIRGCAVSLREKEYVDAARILGKGRAYIIARHILPNCLGPALVITSSFFALALLAESALSFLGLGTPPPLPSWGGMLADARAFFTFAPWLSVFPGLAIVTTLLGVNLIGDWVRDRLDPRMNEL